LPVQAGTSSCSASGRFQQFPGLGRPMATAQPLQATSLPFSPQSVVSPKTANCEVPVTLSTTRSSPSLRIPLAEPTRQRSPAPIALDQSPSLRASFPSHKLSGSPVTLRRTPSQASSWQPASLQQQQQRHLSPRRAQPHQERSRAVGPSGGMLGAFGQFPRLVLQSRQPDASRVGGAPAPAALRGGGGSSASTPHPRRPLLATSASANQLQPQLFGTNSTVDTDGNLLPASLMSYVLSSASVAAVPVPDAVNGACLAAVGLIPVIPRVSGAVPEGGQSPTFLPGLGRPTSRPSMSFRSKDEEDRVRKQVEAAVALSLAAERARATVAALISEDDGTPPSEKLRKITEDIVSRREERKAETLSIDHIELAAAPADHFGQISTAILPGAGAK